MSTPVMTKELVQTRRARRAEAALMVLAVLAVIAAAKFAQDFVIPVVLGIFGAYALRPLVLALRSMHVPEALAVGIVMAGLLMSLFGIGYALREQAVSALADLPQAAHTLRLRVRDFVNDGKASSISQVKKAAAELKKAASEVSGSPVAAPPAPAGPDLIDRLASNGVNALGVLGTAGVALAVTLFLLASGDTFRRKLMHVAGNTLAERRITLQILDEIDNQIQRYMLVMFATNVALGFVLWGLYAALGVERPALWATAAAVLHAIPYLGVVMVLVMMAAVAMLQFGTMGLILTTLGLTALAATAIGLFLQNWLQGRASRMNPVAVFVSVLFFGWLWGGWGLLVGAPLIAIVRTIASRIAALSSLDEFLSDGATRRQARAQREVATTA